MDYQERPPEDDGASLIETERLEIIIHDALIRSGRINEVGQVQPLVVKRMPCLLQEDEPKTPSTLRHDVFFPDAKVQHYYTTDDSGRRYRNIAKMRPLSDVLYEVITTHENINLGPAQAQRLETDMRAFEQTMNGSKEYHARASISQHHPSVRISPKTPVNSEIAPTRIYVPAGIAAVNIMHRVIKNGADFSYVKMPMPWIKEGAQKFRRDTPIFEAETLQQLHSIVTNLRELSQQGQLPLYARPYVGYEVPDLPGVYMGQAVHGSSFNGMMRKLFTEPIAKSCETATLRAGDRLDSGQLSSLSRNALRYAVKRADELGIDPTNHAFLKNQPKEAILDAIKA